MRTALLIVGILWSSSSAQAGGYGGGLQAMVLTGQAAELAVPDVWLEFGKRTSAVLAWPLIANLWTSRRSSGLRGFTHLVVEPAFDPFAVRFRAGGFVRGGIGIDSVYVMAETGVVWFPSQSQVAPVIGGGLAFGDDIGMVILGGRRMPNPDGTAFAVTLDLMLPLNGDSPITRLLR